MRRKTTSDKTKIFSSGDLSVEPVFEKQMLLEPLWVLNYKSIHSSFRRGTHCN